MNTKTDSYFNEENQSSGLGSMSDDCQSLENGLTNSDQQDAREDAVQYQGGHVLIANHDRIYEEKDFNGPPCLLSKIPVQINSIPTLPNRDIAPRENQRFGVTGGGFLPVTHIYTPFGDASKDNFLDSDLETIEEESSVLESDFDDRSSVGYNRKKFSSDFLQGRNRSSSGSVSSIQSDSHRGSVTSAGTGSDDELSSSTLSSSASPKRSSISSRSNPSTPNNECQEKRNLSEIPFGLQNGHNRGNTHVYEIDAINPNYHQKIVYAKCLSPEEERRNIYRNYVPKSSKTQNGPKPPSHYEAHPMVDNRTECTELTITEMFEAVRRGNLDILKRFSPTEQSETADERGNTILHAATTSGQLHCVQYLAKGSCAQAISLLNDDLMTPAALSVQHGHLGCVQWLVENTSAKEELIVSSRQASIDGTNMRPPLAHVAARYNQDSVLDWLCEQMTKEHFPVDSSDHHSNTTVHEAAAHGHLKCLQTLVGRGASVTVLNSHGDTPGQVADKKGHDLCVGYLVVVETCMSLAQQLITVKLENEGIRKDNNALRMQVQAMHNAKLAHAKESVEERIRATLQNLTSYEEDNENQQSSPVIQHSQVKVYSPLAAGVVQQSPVQNGLPSEQSSKPSPNATPPASNDKNIDRTVHMTGRFAAAKSSSGNTTVERINTAQEKPSTYQKKEDTQGTVVQESRPAKLPNNLSNGKVFSKLFGNSVSTANQNNTHEDDRSHGEVRNLTRGLTHEVKTKENQSQPSPGQSQTVKAWEKMAMDEVLRLARDSRYLPSPTISMCTEDSTMETREVMRDRLTEASRWFLVQQSGKPRIKDAMLPGNSISPMHSGNAFTKPYQKPFGSTILQLKGPQKYRTDNGPIRTTVTTPQRASLPQNFIAATNQQYQALYQQNGPLTLEKTTTHPQLQGSPVSPITSSSSSCLTGQRVHASAIRPTSAKSTTSTASTVRSLPNSSSSKFSNSTNFSQDTVVENEIIGRSNTGLSGCQDNDPLQKRRLSHGSPNSSCSRASSRPNSAKNPKDAIQIFDQVDSSGCETAQVRVALPTRNNSFLRKVQPSSYPDPNGQATDTTSTSSTVISYPPIANKSPSKRSTSSPSNTKFNNATSSVKSPVLAGSRDPVQVCNSSATSGFLPISAKMEPTSNSSGYAMWKASTRPIITTHEQQSTGTGDSPNSIAGNSRKGKSPSKYPYGGLFSSNSPKTSSRKRPTKLFHF